MHSLVVAALEKWAQWELLRAATDIGIDQTPFNFIVQREGAPIHFLPQPFNLLHCFPMNPSVQMMEDDLAVDDSSFTERAFAEASAFSFVDCGFIWHFTIVIRRRELVMSETWNRVKSNYEHPTPRLL